MDQTVSIGERLRSERQRLDMNQTQIGECGGVTKKTQMLYEAGERFPDAAYLAAIAKAGADVRYIITGECEGSAPESLSSEERYLLDRYRNSPSALRDAALRVLIGGDAGGSRKIQKQTNVSVGTNHGQMAEKIVNKKP